MKRRFLGPAALLVLAFGATAGVVIAATVNVNVGNYFFEDATVGDGMITAKVGDQLRLTTVDRGTDGRPHTADIDELNIHSGALTPGSTWVSPVITKPGTFQLYCKVHLRSQDHATTLVVTGTAITPTPVPSRAAPVPTASPAPGATGGAGGSTPLPAPGASGAGAPAPGGSAAPASSGSPAVGGAGGTGQVPGASASPDEVLTPGLSGGTADDWARSVRLGLVLLLPIGALAAVVALRSRARSTSAPWRPQDPRSQARPGGPAGRG